VRLGIFGGTFDPPHVGHLLAASDAFEALSLDRLLFIPAYVQPLKEGATATSAELRMRMTQLLAGADPRFAVDPIEVSREGVSFMVDTLRALDRVHAGASLHLILGMDVLESFQRWREPDEVLRRAQLVLVRRQAAGEEKTETREGLVALQRMAERAGAQAPRVLDTRIVDVSSTEIRSRVAAGLSIHGFVPDAVAEVIASAGLYR
jgi:nicotinate-nucleotide adenylyltransferase